MTVEATPTTYSRLAGENFGGAIFLHHTIKKELRYSYASLSFNAFSKEFDSHKWCSRKLSAMALGVTLIASITFQTIRLFVLLFTCPSKESLKIKAYHLARSAEVFGGSLLTLFWDRLGSFVVQRASFHISCYKSFENQSFISKPFQIKYLEILHKDGFTAFKNLDRMIQTALWEELQLPSTVENFLKNEAMAKLVFDALVEFKSGQLDLKYAFMSEDDFWNIKMIEIIRLSRKETLIFRERLKLLPERVRTLSSNPIQDLNNVTLREFSESSGDVLTPYLNEIPAFLLRLLNSQQLEALDIRQFNMNMILVKPMEERNLFFRRLTNEQIHSINILNISFQSFFLTAVTLERLTDLQIITLHYLRLRRNQYEQLAARLCAKPALLKQISIDKLSNFPEDLQTKLKAYLTA